LVWAFGIIPNDVGYCRLGRARQAKAEQSQRLKETAHDGHEELLVRNPSRHQIPSLDLIDVEALAKSVTDQWYNQTLCRVNDSVVRLGVTAT
jgi:hypothetical protein